VVDGNGVEGNESTSSEEEVGTRNKKEDFSSDFHQLVVAIARKGGTNSNKVESNKGSGDRNYVRGVRTNGTAANEDTASEYTHKNHVTVLSEEELCERKGRVINVVTSNKLSLSLGKVKGSTVCFSEHGNKEDQAYRQ
jgi:hypothetical protein